VCKFALLGYYTAYSYCTQPKSVIRYTVNVTFFCPFRFLILHEIWEKACPLEPMYLINCMQLPIWTTLQNSDEGMLTADLTL